MTRWIVKSHENTLVSRIRRPYERREAAPVWGTPEHRMLRRARINAVQVLGPLALIVVPLGLLLAIRAA